MRPISSLQSLPNELLIELFEYLSGHSLYQSFSGLNQRFDQLLRSISKIYFEQVEEQSVEDTAIAERIENLVIRHHHPIDLSRYRNLRRITLQWPTEQQCKQVLEHVRLEHIYLGHPLYPVSCEKLIEAIFSNRFPSLQSCHLENLSHSNFISTSPLIALAKVTSVTLLTKYPNDFTHVLASCPQLEHLAIKFFSKDTSFHDLLRTPSTMKHIRLRRLTLDNVDHMSIEAIDHILSFTPNVSQLIIINPCSSREKILLRSFSQTLCRQVPNLQRFSAQIWLDELDSTEIYSKNMEKLQSLHPLFRHGVRSIAGGKLIISSMSS